MSILHERSGPRSVSDLFLVVVVMVGLEEVVATVVVVVVSMFFSSFLFVLSLCIC